MKELIIISLYFDCCCFYNHVTRMEDSLQEMIVEKKRTRERTEWKIERGREISIYKNKFEIFWLNNIQCIQIYSLGSKNIIFTYIKCTYVYFMTTLINMYVNI